MRLSNLDLKTYGVQVCFNRISAKCATTESNTNKRNTTKSNTKVKSNQLLVLEFCKDTSHTANEIFKHLKISVQVKHYEVYIQQLVNAGKLKDVTIDKKRNKKYIKYYISLTRKN